MDLAILKALSRSYKKRRNEEEGRIEGRKEGGRQKRRKEKGASPEFAGPRSLFHSHIASSRKISMAIIGPLVINWISSL